VLPRVGVLSSPPGARGSDGANGERPDPSPHTRGYGDLVRLPSNRSTRHCVAQFPPPATVINGQRPFFRRGTVGELPQAPERFIDLSAEGQGVEGAVQRLERGALVGRQDAGRQQALMGCLGAIVAFRDPGAVADLGGQLAEGLEEVPVEAQDTVEGVEVREGRAGRVAIVANEAAYDRPVLLLGVGLIVLAPGAAAGEVDVFAAAPGEEEVVEKLPAIIGMELAQGHGQALADEVHAGADALVAFAPDGVAFRPAGGDIDGDQRGQEEAGDSLAAMADEIGLEAARPDALPLAEGADGDLRGEGGMPGPRDGEAAGMATPIGTQEPIDGGGADAQERGAQRWGDLQDAMAFEGLDQGRQERREAFATEIVARFPDGPQEGEHLRAIAGRSARAGSRPARARSKEPDRRLPMALGEATELIQQARFCSARGEDVSGTEGCGVFADALRTHDASWAR